MRAENDPCADGRTTTETDWLPIFLTLAAVTYSGAHYIGHEFDYINHFSRLARRPSVRTTVAILYRLSIDFIRFILALLGMILLLVLECKNAISSFSRRFWDRSIVAGESTSAIKWMSLQYDAASHSHRANATRQELRAARARTYTVLRWGIPVAAVVLLLHGPPDFTDSSPVMNPEVRPYRVPGWIIRARPENRQYGRSNSHYTPSSECLILDELCVSKIQNLQLKSAGLQSSSMMLSGNVEQHMDVSEDALLALRSEDTSMIGNDDNFSTLILAHTQTETEIETETETMKADKSTATMTGTVRSSSDDTMYRYCSACRQKHCCSFP
jgi:hypothetical protein